MRGVICMLCVFVRTGLKKTVRRSPWLMEADRIMITCTECTCQAFTAAAAVTAARPASLQEHTLSATLPLLSTCELHTHTTSTTHAQSLNTFRSPLPSCEGFNGVCVEIAQSLWTMFLTDPHISTRSLFDSSMCHHSFICEKNSNLSKTIWSEPKEIYENGFGNI